jgi:hypothetical protein
MIFQLLTLPVFWYHGYHGEKWLSQFVGSEVGTGNYAWINFIGALPCISMFLGEGVSTEFQGVSRGC